MIASEERIVFCSGPADLELRSAGICNAVSAQALKTPDAVALTRGTCVLTYHELDRRASRVAHYLLSLGVGAEVPVGLCLPRSPDMVVAALGILRAGGAYVPIEPSSPPARLAFILSAA